MRRHSTRIFGGMLALGLLSPVPALPQTYSFEAIGGCEPYGINDQGVVAGFCNTPPALQGFVYADGTTTLVTDPLDPSGSTFLYGIDDEGVIVGSSGARSFLLRNGVYRTITDASSTFYLGPAGINNKGAFAGTLTTSAGNSGFVFASKQITRLTNPVNSINDSQDVVGATGSPAGEVGYQIVGGEYSTFSVPNSTGTYPMGINDQGTISGWYGGQETTHGFVLRHGKYATVDYPGAGFTYLGGVNRSGQVVGYGGIINGGVVGFIATPMP